MHPLVDNAPRLVDVATQIHTLGGDKHIARRAAVVALDHRRPLRDGHRGNLPQRDGRAARGHDRQILQFADAVPIRPRIAQADGEAFQPFDRLGDLYTADRHADHVLNVADIEAKTRRFDAIGRDLDISTAIGPVCIGRLCAWYRA
jgi:hypothetical protein